MEHAISIETSEGQYQSSVVLNKANQNQSNIVNEETEQEIYNERQERNEQAADWESTANEYLGTILRDYNQLEIKNEVLHFPCQKVPPSLRNSERSKDYFDPKIVSFGPYHHGKTELQAAQMIKTKVMQDFISLHGKKIEDLYIKILKDLPRSCYVDVSTDAYGDEEFALMMLQDGCFILFLIESMTLTSTFQNNNVGLTILEMLANHLGLLEFKYLYRDMFLLENQIPFIVLKVLMSNIYNENEGLEMIKSYLYRIYWGKFPKEDTRDKNNDNPHHLLGLLKTLISNVAVPENEDISTDVTRYRQSFSSVSDLQAKGINLKPSNSISLLSAQLKEKPKSISLRDVDFRSGFFTGELKLPPLFVGNNFQVYLTNLIAFEMCDYSNDRTVTSYINFMNSLIDNPKDVKVLRSKRIILHSRNSDEEMFKLLKDLSSPDWILDVSSYQGVREKIERHYNSKKKIWIAEVRHEYFSRPWYAIGLLAAVVVLILTFLQTFFTIYPQKA